MTEKITMIELFSGIGAQEKALRQIGVPYEVVATCDLDKDAVLSYAAMRNDFENEFTNYNFPSADKMIEELQSKNVGFDFGKGKHTITTRTPVDKLKQYYLADKLSKNLGDIGILDKLPYADMVTYSFPCTDLSVAGKGEGMTNKCDKCGHTWPIDFSIAESDIVCPNCGNTEIKSTRSGLLGEVQRLLSASKEENNLPKYLLLENVKNLVGKKFKPQFLAWINWLDSIGYNTYYEVLNAKHYGIPQNRERIFALSIRKDIDDGTFKFPGKITLTTRLKDILEKNVDEKFYLPDERVSKILTNWETLNKRKTESDSINIVGNYMPSNHDASRVVDINGVAPTVKENHGTVTAIAEPNIIKVGQLESSFEQSGRVYDSNGISPTIMSNSHGKTSGGYTSPKIVVEEPNTCLIQPKDRDYKKKNQPREVHIESKNDGISYALRTNGETMVIEPFIVASRGRNPENPSDRTTGSPTEQRLEPNFSGCTNTLTSVQKDNYVAEPIVCEERRDEGIRFFKDDCVGTLRTIDACGDKRVIELDMNPQLVGGIGEKNFGKQYRQGNRVYDSNAVAMALNAQPVGNAGGYSYLYAVEENNNQYGVKVKNQATELVGFVDVAGTLMARDYKGFGNQEMNAALEVTNIDLIQAGTLDGTGPEMRRRVYDENGISPTLCGIGQGGNTEPKILTNNIKWRIRKLTTKECWRLMGFTDEDHDKAARYVSASALYKQAGNSICTCCLIAIFNTLFLNDYTTSYEEKLVDYNKS